MEQGIDPLTPADEVGPAMPETSNRFLFAREHRDPAAGGATGRWDGSGTLSGMGVSRFLQLGLLLAVWLAGAAVRAQPVAVADTLVVTAGSEDLAGVIAAVGRRMREADLRAAPYAYTTVTTRTDAYGPDDSTGVVIVTRTVARQIRDQDQGGRTVTLATRTRRFEDGNLVWESTRDEPGSARWREPARPLLESLPFAEGAADKYRYEVRERHLVGNTLIYRIAFTPRNRFDPLPSGEVWVDYAGWVMRRLVAHMDRGTTPTALLDEVPLYRLVQEQRDGLWLPVDVHLVMDLKPAPLVTLPRRMDLRVQVTDVEVRGSVDARHRRLTADERDPEEFWLTPEAAADSLAAFWARVDAPWTAGGDSLTMDGPPVAVEDSLVTWADGQLAALAHAGRPWLLSAVPLAPRFNRALGLVPRVRVTAGRAGDPAPSARLWAGWGLAEGRGVGKVEVGREAVGHRRWGWQLAAWSQARPFVAADRPLRDISALLYGADPRSFVREDAAHAVVLCRLGTGLRIEVRAGVFRHRSLDQATDWNLGGQDPSPGALMAAEAVEGHTLGLGLQGIGRGWRWRTEAGSWSYTGRPDRWRLQAEVGWKGQDAGGNAWRLSAGGVRWTRTAPVQDQVWLGGWGSLGGWPAGRLRGDQGLTAQVETDLAADLLRAVRFPVLAGMRLQPVIALEGGWTDGGGPLGSVAAGFQRRLGLPVLGRFQNLRMLAAWPVGPGAQEAGMRVLVGMAE